LHGNTYCSLNEKACNKFHKLLHLSLEMMIEIKSCSETIFKVCLNSKRKCVRNILVGKKIRKKHVTCPCLGQYQFECGSNYCSKDVKSCNQFKKSNLTLDDAKIYICT